MRSWYRRRLSCRWRDDRLVDERSTDPPGPFCAFCGKALGVYEPLILIGRDQSAVRTSRSNRSGLPDEGLMVHEDCYEKRQPWSEGRARLSSVGPHRGC